MVPDAVSSTDICNVFVPDTESVVSELKAVIVPLCQEPVLISTSKYSLFVG